MNATQEEQFHIMLRALLRIRDEVTRKDGSVENRLSLVGVEYIHQQADQALNAIGLGQAANAK